MKLLCAIIDGLLAFVASLTRSDEDRQWDAMRVEHAGGWWSDD